MRVGLKQAGRLLLVGRAAVTDTAPRGADSMTAGEWLHCWGFPGFKSFTGVAQRRPDGCDAAG